MSEANFSWTEFSRELIGVAKDAESVAQATQQALADFREESRRRLDRAEGAAASATDAAEARVERRLREAEGRLNTEMKAVEGRVVEASRLAAAAAAQAAASSALESLAATMTDLKNLRGEFAAALLRLDRIDADQEKRIEKMEQSGAKLGGKMWGVFIVVGSVAGTAGAGIATVLIKLFG